MRARLILFLAPALFVTGLLLVLASALVSDLEPPAVAESAFAIEPIRAEASCAVIQRQVDSLARTATVCEADPGCLHSPILCAVAMDEARVREYERLRDRLDEECGIMRTASYRPARRSPYEAEVCGVSEESRALSSRERVPRSFVF